MFTFTTFKLPPVGYSAAFCVKMQQTVFQRGVVSEKMYKTQKSWKNTTVFALKSSLLKQQIQTSLEICLLFYSSIYPLIHKNSFVSSIPTRLTIKFMGNTKICPWVLFYLNVKNIKFAW